MSRRLLLILSLFLFFLSAPAFPEGRKILTLKLEGVINTVSADLVRKAVEEGRKDYSALIVQLDTEGGLDKSMRQIVKQIQEAAVPVIVYVSPKGARAASAGVFITLAAKINAMAPATNIGAAHPVNMLGKVEEEMAEKITNDAAAYIRSIAQETGRNAEWAEKAVRESVSITAEEAQEKKVVDIIATNLDDLLDKLEGWEVIIKGQTKVLHTKEAIVDEFKIGFKDRFLHVLGNPNIAYILLMIGIWGLILEFSHPGTMIPGTVGSISLILGLYALHTLPVNYAGLGLIVLSIILFFLETQTPTNGILTVGGVISLGVGSFILIGSEARYLSLSRSLVFTVMGVTTVLFILVLTFAIKAQFRKVITGQEGLLNQVGYAKTTVGNEGSVYVLGEYWSATSYNGKKIKQGEKVEVVKKEGRTLVVKPQNKSNI